MVEKLVWATTLRPIVLAPWDPRLEHSRPQRSGSASLRMHTQLGSPAARSGAADAATGIRVTNSGQTRAAPMASCPAAGWHAVDAGRKPLSRSRRSSGRSAGLPRSRPVMETVSRLADGSTISSNRDASRRRIHARAPIAAIGGSRASGVTSTTITADTPPSTTSTSRSFALRATRPGTALGSALSPSQGPR